MTEQKPIAYLEGETLVFRASGLGNSVRALTLALRGYEPSPPPPALQRAFDAGNRLEDQLLERAEYVLGQQVAHRQEQFTLPIDDDVAIRGHIDGRTVAPQGQGWLVEAKALGPELFDSFSRNELFERMPGYAYQVWAQMVAYHDRLLYIVGPKKDGKVTNLEIVQKVYTVPPPVALEVQAKLAAVREHYRRGTLPEACDCKGWCPYSYLHPAVDTDDDLATELQDLATTYTEAKIQRDAADEMMEGARARMAKLLESHGVDKAVTPTYAVTKYQRTNMSYDYKAAKAAGLDLTPYERKSISDILKVTARSQDAT